MNDKKIRQQVIKQMVKRLNISSQEELQARLKKEGIKATQATISRDLKDLHLVKLHDDKKGYTYGYAKNKAKELKTETAVSGVVGVEFSGNIAVVKTMPGYANVVAGIIDEKMPLEFAGTVAGDDTLLAVIKEGVGHEKAFSALSLYLPNVSD